MKRNVLEQELESLRSELRIIAVMDEESVCKHYQVDSKEEAIQYYEEEIGYCKKKLEELDLSDDGMNYRNLQLSQGMAVTHW